MKNKTGNVTRRKMLKFSMFAGAGIALGNIPTFPQTLKV